MVSRRISTRRGLRDADLADPLAELLHRRPRLRRPLEQLDGLRVVGDGLVAVSGQAPWSATTSQERHGYDSRLAACSAAPAGWLIRLIARG